MRRRLAIISSSAVLAVAVGTVVFVLIGAAWAAAVVVAITGAAAVAALLSALEITLGLGGWLGARRRRPAPKVVLGPDLKAALAVEVRDLAPFDHAALRAGAIEAERLDAQGTRLWSMLDPGWAPIAAEQVRGHDANLIVVWEPQLRAWLGELEATLREQALLAEVPAAVMATGSAVSALEVVLELPAGVSWAPGPHPLPPYPAPSRLSLRRSALWRVMDDRHRREEFMRSMSSIARVRIPGSPAAPASSTPSEPLVDGDRVEFELAKARPGRAEALAVLPLRFAGPGRYTIGWTIRADELQRPARGSLTIDVRQIVARLPAVTDIDELWQMPGVCDDEDEELRGVA